METLYWLLKVSVPKMIGADVYWLLGSSVQKNWHFENVIPFLSARRLRQTRVKLVVVTVYSYSNDDPL